MSKQSGLIKMRVLALVVTGVLLPQFATAARVGSADSSMDRMAGLLGPVTSSFGNSSSADSMQGLTSEELQANLRKAAKNIAEGDEEIKVREKNEDVINDIEYTQKKSQNIRVGMAKITSERNEKNKAAALKAKNTPSSGSALGANDLNTDNVNPWCADESSQEFAEVKSDDEALHSSAVTALRNGAKLFSKEAEKGESELIKNLIALRDERKKQAAEHKANRGGRFDDAEQGPQVGSDEFKVAARIAKMKAARPELEAAADQAEDEKDELITGENGLINFAINLSKHDEKLSESLTPFADNTRKKWKSMTTKLIEGAKKQYAKCDDMLRKMGRGGKHSPGEMNDAFKKTQMLYKSQADTKKREEYKSEFDRLQQELACKNVSAKIEALTSKPINEEIDKLFTITDPSQLIESSVALLDTMTNTLKSAVQLADESMMACSKIADKRDRVKAIAGDMKKQEDQMTEGFASAMRSSAPQQPGARDNHNIGFGGGPRQQGQF